MSYHWELITMDAPFAPRDGAGALTLNGTMYLLGGWNPGDKVNFPKICNSEVWASTDGLNWTEINEQAPWEGRHCAGWIEYRDELWIVGGDCNQGHYQTDVWKSPDGVNWTQVCDDLPWGKRTVHMTHAFQDKLWVLGEAPAPAPDGHATTGEVAADLAVAHALGGEQDNAATQHHPLRRGLLPNGLLKVRTIGLGQDNRDSAWARHASLLGGDDDLFHIRFKNLS